jgi:Fur family peroxide stress response transcriptional regulator
MLKIDEFINAMRERGLNVTYQRILIYKYLINKRSHPTADEIYREIISEYPSISLATVYKTLETLEEHNLISKVNALHDLARFDGDTTPHHHLICLRCKKIVDIYDDHLENLPLPSNNGFKVSGYRIQFEGICEDCAAQAQSEKPISETNQVITFCGKETKVN